MTRYIRIQNPVEADIIGVISPMNDENYQNMWKVVTHDNITCYVIDSVFKEQYKQEENNTEDFKNLVKELSCCEEQIENLKNEIQNIRKQNETVIEKYNKLLTLSKETLEYIARDIKDINSSTHAQYANLINVISRFTTKIG